MAPSLLWDGVDDEVRFAPGSLASQTFDNITIACIGKRNSTGQNGLVVADSGAAQGWNLKLESNANGNDVTGGSSAGDSFVVMPIVNADGWFLAAVTKGSGTVVPRYHRFLYATKVWTHAAGDTALAAGASPSSSGSISIAFSRRFTEPFGGNVLIAAVWSRALGDLELEALPYSIQSWKTAGPAEGWRLNGLGSITSFVSGGTAVESSRGGGGPLLRGDAPDGWIDEVIVSLLPPFMTMVPGGQRVRRAPVPVATPASTAQQIAQALTATVTTVATFAVQVGKSMSATASSTASIVKQITHPLTATATSTATVVKSVGKRLTANATVTATMSAIKVILVALTATVTSTASIVKQVAKPLTATVTSTSTIVRSVGKRVTATVTTTASIVKSVGKPLSATVTTTASLLAQKAKLLTMTATATVSATMTRSVGKSVVATAATSASIVRRTNKTVAAAATVSAVFVKQVAHRMAATVTTTASLVAQFISGAAQTIYTFFYGPPSPDAAELGGQPGGSTLDGGLDANTLGGTPDSGGFGPPGPRRNG